MKRSYFIVGAAAALFAGFYLYDRGNRSDEVIAATVVSLDDQDHDAGPDTWHITADYQGDQIKLEPLLARPNLKPGDRICVTKTTRNNHPVEYRLAPANSSC